MKTAPCIERRPFRKPIIEPGTVGPPDDAGMLNASQAAAFLNVSVHKISRLVRRGDLPPYTLVTDRRQRLFDRADLEAVRAQVRRMGNDWEEPSADNLQARDEVYERLAQHGIAPGPNGYDLMSLIAVAENRGWAWKVEKESGPWVFGEKKWPIYEAEVDRPYRPGFGGLSVTSHAWTPDIALARSLAEVLDNERSGESLLY